MSTNEISKINLFIGWRANEGFESEVIKTVKSYVDN
jgi:hypothetical protein